MNQVPAKKPKAFFERIPVWVGSLPSLVIHTIFFASIFVLGFSGIVPAEYIFAITTNILSIEAIYLAIFIQMTVNRHQKELEEVSEDVEDIQEDIQEISEDVEDLGENVEDIQDDIQEIQETAEEEEVAEEERKKKQLVSLEQLTGDIKRVLADIETLKSQK